jgi:hypothetical protein
MIPLIINIFQSELIKSIAYEKNHYTTPSKNKAVRIGRKEKTVERVNHTDSSCRHPNTGYDP